MKYLVLNRVINFSNISSNKMKINVANILAGNQTSRSKANKIQKSKNGNGNKNFDLSNGTKQI